MVNNLLSIAKEILGEKEIEDFSLPNFKLYYKEVIIKQCGTGISTNLQINGIEFRVKGETSGT